MRIAIPHWQGRVSPVFDAAGSVLLIDVEDGGEIERQERRLTRTDATARASEFLQLGADVLICGAISASLEAVLVSSQVEVIGFVCGPVEEVLAAYLKNELTDAVFGMPGTRGWRRDREFRRETMPRGSGMESACARGGSRRRGGMGGPQGKGPGGHCVCPKCGEKTAHTAGQPCHQEKCPKCGSPMTRE